MYEKKKKKRSGSIKCKQTKQMYRYVREACDFTTNPHPLKGFASIRTCNSSLTAPSRRISTAKCLSSCINLFMFT